MLTCFYQMSVHHAAQSAQLWRSAMEGKLLIANPNCTTAIAAMALWPSAAQCDDNPKGVIVCRRKRRFLSHQSHQVNCRSWIFGFQHLLKFKKSASNSPYIMSSDMCKDSKSPHIAPASHGSHGQIATGTSGCRCLPVPLRSIPIDDAARRALAWAPIQAVDVPTSQQPSMKRKKPIKPIWKSSSLQPFCYRSKIPNIGCQTLRFLGQDSTMPWRL